MASSTAAGIRDKIQEKLGLKEMPDRVVDLIAERQKDKGKEDDLLPKIPSAQLWAKFSENDKTKFRELMEKHGKNPDEILKAHWPKTPFLPLVTRWRELKK